MLLSDENKRFLVIRFSSFGDVLLTTALLRNLKKNYPNSHISYIVKQPFNQMLEGNPNIDEIHIFESVDKLSEKLIDQHFDYLIDLQHNPISIRLRKQINHRHYFNYDKQSISRYVYLKLKKGNYNLPIKSVPQRYIDTVKLNLEIDSSKPDFFIDPNINIDRFDLSTNYICIAPGAAHFTKQWPVESFIELIDLLNADNSNQIVLIGGKNETDTSTKIEAVSHVINLVGQTSFSESALIVKSAKMIICNDSSIMHFARVFTRPILTFFGSTTERFGFFPYETDFIALENNDLACRPCSHYGRSKCPKGHFKCMKSISANDAYNAVKSLLEPK